MRASLWPMLLAMLTAACAEAVPERTLPAARPVLQERTHTDRLVTLPRPPILSAEAPADLPSARLNAERTRWEELYRRIDAQPVSIDALPFLASTPEGQRFLAAQGPRAIARGMPAESCPATVAWTPPPPIALPSLVEGVLQRCIAALAPAYPGCGCRVLAVDDRLTVPRDEVGYATGTTARLRVPELGIDQVLVAEDEGPGVLLRDLAGPLARVSRGAGDRVRVDFLRGGRSFQGRSIPVGYRRGRVAERIYASDDSGATLRLLIGFAPEELAERAAAWLAWPG